MKAQLRVRDLRDLLIPLDDDEFIVLECHYINQDNIEIRAGDVIVAEQLRATYNSTLAKVVSVFSFDIPTV